MTLAIDTETTGLFIHKGCRAFIVSMADDKFNTYLWRFDVNPIDRTVSYPKSSVQEIKDVITNHKKIVFHNANFDLQALEPLGIPSDYFFKNHDVHDTMVMSHAYRSLETHGLKELAISILEFPDEDEKELEVAVKAARKEAEKLGWTIAKKTNLHHTLRGLQGKDWASDYWVPEQLAIHLGYPKDHPYRNLCKTYAIKDVERTIGLFEVMPELMTQQQLDSYENRRKDLKPILDMEKEKVTLIPYELARTKKIYTERREKQIKKLRDISKSPSLNLSSPPQLRSIFFQKYGFKPTKYGKKGDPSTDKDVINTLLKDCPQKKPPERFQFLIELKKLRKINNTYTYLTNYDIHRDKDYYLQTNCNQNRTGTGRLSFDNPNTTNVGKKDANNPFGEEPGLEHLKDLLEAEDSFKLRNVFGPKEGEIWTCIDYEKFQLLIFAVVSDSKPLLKAFELGLDPHDEVAKTLFKKDNISSVERTAAKAVNFGILFGAGPKKIELIAGMPGLYSLFTARFPKANKYLEDQMRQARVKGYVHTVGGYRLYVPRETPYAASCYVIQGTEAEIVRNAMQDVNEYTYHTKSYMNHNDISPKNTGSSLLESVRKPCPYRMILMVHDELVFRSKGTSIPHLRNIMTLMEQAGHKLGIPAKVSADIVRTNWATKEPIDL